MLRSRRVLGKAGEKRRGVNAPLPLAAVVFDLDDTLHDDTLSFNSAAQHVATTCFSDHELGARAAAAYVRELERFWQALSEASVSRSVVGMRERVWTVALASIPDAPQIGAECAKVYDAYRREHFVLWDGVRELLLTLRGFGSRVGLLTNGFRETHREKIALLGLEDLLDAVIISDEVGMVKPNPAIFQLMSERLGVPASQTTMVGDRYDKDILGAKSVGMKTIWLNIRQESLSATDPQPEHTVADFRGVANILRATMQATPLVERI